jgi:hypothetical protein
MGHAGHCPILGFRRPKSSIIYPLNSAVLVHRIGTVQPQNSQRLRESCVVNGAISAARRDDPTKRHPCLVPYAELPDSEKEYDRLMATQTLKAIVALGYRVTK